MELLTGKAKEKLLELYNNDSTKFLLNWIEFQDLPILCQNALIIHFFDSVGIYIELMRSLNSYKVMVHEGIFHKNKLDKEGFKTRKEATIAGIKKANEILNNKLKTSHLQ